MSTLARLLILQVTLSAGGALRLDEHTYFVDARPRHEPLASEPFKNGHDHLCISGTTGRSLENQQVNSGNPRKNDKIRHEALHHLLSEPCPNVFEPHFFSSLD